MQDRSAFDDLQNILVKNSHMNADVRKSNRLEMMIATPGDGRHPDPNPLSQMDLTVTKRGRPDVQHRLRISPADMRGYVKSETWIYEPVTQSITHHSQPITVELELVLDQLRELLES